MASNGTRFYKNYPPEVDQGDGSLPVWILSCVLTPIALLTVILRIVSSIRHHRRLFSADISLIIAIILFGGIWAEQIVALQFGLGKKFYTLADEDIVIQLKLVFAWRVTHAAAKLAAQIGIIYMLKEAWTLKNRWFRYAWLSILVLTILTGLLAIIVDLVQCIPIAKFWDLTYNGEGSCFDYTLLVLLSTIPFGATSVMLLALPLLPMWFSKASYWLKSGMYTMWMFAFFLTWCIGAYPTLIIYEYSPSGNTFAPFVDVYILSDCEVFAAIMLAAVPGALRAFSNVDDAGKPSATEEVIDENSHAT